jgi:hypothetical protein
MNFNMVALNQTWKKIIFKNESHMVKFKPYSNPLETNS